MSEHSGMTVLCRQYARRLTHLNTRLNDMPNAARTDFNWHQIQLERSVLKDKLKQQGWIWRGK